MPAETCQNTEPPICNELHNPLSISNDAQIVDPQRGTQNLVPQGVSVRVRPPAPPPDRTPITPGPAPDKVRAATAPNHHPPGRRTPATPRPDHHTALKGPGPSRGQQPWRGAKCPGHHSAQAITAAVSAALQGQIEEQLRTAGYEADSDTMIATGRGGLPSSLTLLFVRQCHRA